MIDIQRLRELYNKSTQGEWIAAAAQKGSGLDAWIYVEPKDPDTEFDIPIVDCLNYGYYASSAERLQSLAAHYQFENAINDIEFIATIHNALPELLDMLECKCEPSAI